MKGEDETPTGVRYQYESINTIPGRAPDSVWVAMGGYPDPDSALIALVGFSPHVERFARRASRLVGRALSVAYLELPDVDVRGCVFLAGVAPEAEAKAIVASISPPGSGYGYWAKQYAQCEGRGMWRPAEQDNDVATELWAMFIQQCELAIVSGRN